AGERVVGDEDRAVRAHREPLAHRLHRLRRPHREDSDLALAVGLAKAQRLLERVGVELREREVAAAVEPHRPGVNAGARRGVRHRLHADRDPHYGVVTYAATRERRYSTISPVGAPGVNTSATPSRFRSAMSSAGMVPPTTTSTSSASRWRRRSRM